MLKRVHSYIAAFVFAFVVLSFPLSAVAQGNQSGGGGQGLEISPPLLNLKADPGQVLKAEINVRNVTKDSLVVKAQFEDFVASGEDGQPKILLESDEQSPYSIKDWISSPSDVTLKPGERKTIKVDISVPNDAGPGGHYGVVRFTGTPPELEGTGVSLSASVGTLILVGVSGDVKESAKIVELFAERNGKKSGVFEYGPLNLVLRVENDGNIHFQPKGTLQVTDTFGRTVFVSQINQDARNVLPGSIRKFEQLMDKKYLFGKYNLKADVVYGDNGQITSQTVTFWVIPYKLIIGFILLLVILIFGFRQYNKFIVGRATRKNNASSTKKQKKTKG